MIKAEDIRKMTKEEIDTKIAALRKEHYTLRVQSKIGKLEKQHRISALKKDIARLMTIRNQMAKSV